MDALKEKYEEYKQQLAEEEKEQRFYSNILKKIPVFKDSNEYELAIEILEKN